MFDVALEFNAQAKESAGRLCAEMNGTAENRHFREIVMQHTRQENTKQEKRGTEFPLSTPLGEMFAHNANLWFAAHAELLIRVDALTHAWLSRRRDGVNSMHEAIQQMTESRDPADMLRIQQQWLTDAFRRVSEDITGLTTGLSTMTAKATVDFKKAAQKVVAPLSAVSEEMRQAAGNKPYGGVWPQ